MTIQTFHQNLHFSGKSTKQEKTYNVFIQNNPDMKIQTFHRTLHFSRQTRARQWTSQHKAWLLDFTSCSVTHTKRLLSSDILKLACFPCPGHVKGADVIVINCSSVIPGTCTMYITSHPVRISVVSERVGSKW